MIVNWQLAIAVCGGAAIGLGVFLVVRELVPATPALGPALRRLHQPPGTGRGRHGRVPAAGLADRASPAGCARRTGSSP